MSPGTKYRLMRSAFVALRRIGRRYCINVENAWESSRKDDTAKEDGR